jgi:hypothetical protein
MLRYLAKEFLASNTIIVDRDASKSYLLCSGVFISPAGNVDRPLCTAGAIIALMAWKFMDGGSRKTLWNSNF